DVLAAAKQERTFTNFFVRLMNELFSNHGLLFIDAAYKPLRQLESAYFCQLIESNERIAAVTAKVEDQFDAEGFGKPIDVNETDAHLFYVHETGRVLLQREEGKFVNESAGLSFTKEELLKIAKNEPEKLSNNVVTRPIMQEAFPTVQLKMHVFVPRISMSRVSRTVEKVLQDEQLTISDVMNGKAAERKQEVFEALQDRPFATSVDEIEHHWQPQFNQLTAQFGEGNHALQQLLQQNFTYHQKQFTYLQEKYEDVVYANHQRQL